MKNKKLWIPIIVGLLILVVGTIVYFVAFKEDKDTTLTLIEKQWIEKNKSKLIDLSIVNNIPMITYNGDGIFFDFLSDLEDDTKLEFNKVAYKQGEEPKSEYALKIVEKALENQILLYRDNYVLVTNGNTKYNKLTEIKDLTIGVLNSDIEKVNTYLNAESNLLLKSFDNYTTMISDLTNSEASSKTVDAIVLPRLIYFKDIVENSDLNIAYHISEITQDYVLQLGNTDKLNGILVKYYTKWEKESYNDSYQNQFLNNYLSFSNVDDITKVEFKSKRYSYGFVQNSPYDLIYDGRYVGINHIFMAKFSDFADIEISYKKYDDIDSLVHDFNENKLDIIFNNATYSTFNMDVLNTVSAYDEKIAVITHLGNNLVVNSINSLKNHEVMAVASSKIADILIKKGINVKSYENVDTLLRNANKNSVIVLDSAAYDYYSNNSLKNYTTAYISDLGEDYTFTIRKTADNDLFANLLNFYLSFNNEQELTKEGYYEVMELARHPFSLKSLVLFIIGVLSAGVLTFLGFLLLKPKKKVKKVNLSKEDKLKYIDMLTSLKNRNYLNDNIEKWDASEVYPQTIVIMDLNNVAYINDNYGHAEGDKVIGEAANILITTQMPNSDIIRTNGNEFLIYMVGYDEKQVVSYVRKLNKEFKSLSHGFGAAIGYSMITDAIKTIDDAINEATASMREIKEEINY
ncbi:MAG: GGDEF domain-containing protein [Firmicutes bacterium]|nr:GGDEF domain-containing protein [Bacillota bacterium]